MVTRLLDEIKAEQIIGGRRSARVAPPLLDVRTTVVAPTQVEYENAYEYRVAVSIGYRGVVAAPSEIPTLQENVVRAVADYAYREVRDLAMKAQRELWEEDHKACIETLSELLREIAPAR